jgi:hypothetical protein
MPRRNGVQTTKVQMSIDEVTSRILDSMILAGLAGKTRGEIASWIIREWIWHNPEALGRLGISIKAEMRPRRRT